MPFGKLGENSAEIVSMMDAMSNPARFQILCILAKNEMAVGNLSKTVGLSQSALSQHLAKLRSKSLVETRREAQTIFYRCESEAVLHILASLKEFYADDTQVDVPPAQRFGS